MADKRNAAIVMFLMLAASFYLFYEYAPQYLLPIGLLVLTWPLIFWAGRSWEKHIFDGYLDYLREVGDLVDPQQAAPAPQPQAPEPQRRASGPISVRDLPERGFPTKLAQREPPTWPPRRIRNRPPRPTGKKLN